MKCPNEPCEFAKQLSRALLGEMDANGNIIASGMKQTQDEMAKKVESISSNVSALCKEKWIRFGMLLLAGVVVPLISGLLVYIWTQHNENSAKQLPPIHAAHTYFGSNQ